MKTKRRITMMIAVFALAIMCVSGAALAADFDSGALTNTSGLASMKEVNDSSTKSIDDYDWKFRVAGIYNSCGKGMLLVPKASDGTIGVGAWINFTSNYYHYIGCGSMESGTTYYLYGRIDDCGSSWMRYNGYWNAN